MPLHLADEVKRHGCLDSFSAFPYENHLGKIKKLIRKPEFPLVQLIRRLSVVTATKLDADADIILKREHFVRPIVVGMGVHAQYGEMQCERWTVKQGTTCFWWGIKSALSKTLSKMIMVCMLFALNFPGSLHSIPTPSTLTE